jgi:hypothetical protein
MRVISGVTVVDGSGNVLASNNPSTPASHMDISLPGRCYACFLRLNTIEATACPRW